MQCGTQFLNEKEETETEREQKIWKQQQQYDNFKINQVCIVLCIKLGCYQLILSPNLA